MCISNFHCVLMYKIDSRWDDYSISFCPVTVSMSMPMSSGIVQFNFMSTPPHARWVWRRKRRGGGGEDRRDFDERDGNGLWEKRSDERGEEASQCPGA